LPLLPLHGLPLPLAQGSPGVPFVLPWPFEPFPAALELPPWAAPLDERTMTPPSSWAALAAGARLPAATINAACADGVVADASCAAEAVPAISNAPWLTTTCCTADGALAGTAVGGDPCETFAVLTLVAPLPCPCAPAFA
jgi:hypothetical protein